MPLVSGCQPLHPIFHPTARRAVALCPRPLNVGVSLLLNMYEEFTVPEYRELTDAERKLLEWLIANGNDDASAYASQLPYVKVVGGCKCGCPSLDLAIGEKKSRTHGISTVLAEVGGHSPEGVPVIVILHACEEEISLLEVVSTDETQKFSLPTPEMIDEV